MIPGGPPILEFLGQPISRTTAGAAGTSSDYNMRPAQAPRVPQQYVPTSSYQPRAYHSQPQRVASFIRPWEDESKGLFQPIKV